MKFDKKIRGTIIIKFIIYITYNLNFGVNTINSKHNAITPYIIKKNH